MVHALHEEGRRALRASRSRFSARPLFSSAHHKDPSQSKVPRVGEYNLPLLRQRRGARASQRRPRDVDEGTQDADRIAAARTLCRIGPDEADGRNISDRVLPRC